MPRRSQRLQRHPFPQAAAGRKRLRRAAWLDGDDELQLSDEELEEALLESDADDAIESEGFEDWEAEEVSDEDPIESESGSEREPDSDAGWSSDDNDDGEEEGEVPCYDQLDAQCHRGSLRLRVSDFVRLRAGALEPVFPWFPVGIEPIVRLEELSGATPDNARCVVTLCVTGAQLEDLQWRLSHAQPAADAELLICSDCHAATRCRYVLDTVAVRIRRPRPAEPRSRELQCWRTIDVDVKRGCLKSRRSHPLAELPPPRPTHDADHASSLLRGTLERYGLPAPPGDDGVLMEASDTPLISLLRAHGAEPCLRFGTAADSAAALRVVGVTEGLPPRLLRPKVTIRRCGACRRSRPCRPYATPRGRTVWLGRNCASKLRAAAELEGALQWLCAHPHRGRVEAAATELTARLEVCRAALY